METPEWDGILNEKRVENMGWMQLLPIEKDEHETLIVYYSFYVAHIYAIFHVNLTFQSVATFVSLRLLFFLFTFYRRMSFCSLHSRQPRAKESQKHWFIVFLKETHTSAASFYGSRNISVYLTYGKTETKCYC